MHEAFNMRLHLICVSPRKRNEPESTEHVRYVNIYVSNK